MPVWQRATDFSCEAQRVADENMVSGLQRWWYHSKCASGQVNRAEHREDFPFPIPSREARREHREGRGEEGYVPPESTSLSTLTARCQHHEVR